MFQFPFFRTSKLSMRALLGDIVAVARAPEAYLDYGVRDDFEGRFERLVLIATLVLRRLRALPPPAGEMAQELVDAIFAHLDDGLRRSGIGDNGLPRRMKKMAQGFYGRADAYTAALASEGDEALREALSRNLLGARIAPESVSSALLAEIHSLNAALEQADANQLLLGTVLAQNKISTDGNHEARS